MKKIITLVLSLFLLITLTGCHGSTVLKEFVMPEEFDTSKNYEITFWNKNDTNITQVNVYKKAIEDFEKIYPNIKIQMKSYSDYTLIYNDVITNIATQTTPNVCVSYPDHIATYLTGDNVVVNLDTLMNDSKYGLGGSEVKFNSVSKDQIVKQFLDECVIDGSFYALPFMRSTEAVYINKTFVEELGFKLPEVLTWDFMFEVAEKALEKGADGETYLLNNQKVMMPFIYKSTDNMMIQMIYQLNAGYSDNEGNNLLFNETTKKLLEMIAPHAETKAFSTFKISSYPGNYLNAGQSIFGVDSTAGSTWMGSKAPKQDIASDNIVDFETEVMAIPQLTDNTKMISQGPSLCLFNSGNDQETLAAWLFMQYLLTYDVQFDYSNTEGYLPVTTEVIDSDEFKNYMNQIGVDDEHYDVKIKAKQILLDNLNNTFTTPVFNGSASLRTSAGQLIEEVCKSSLRKETIDDNYYDSLFNKMNSLYRLDQTNSIELNTDLGELPKEAKILIGSVITIWVLIGAYFVTKKIKNK